MLGLNPLVSYVYVACIYRDLYLYLIGLYLRIDGWISVRDEEGWKSPTSHFMDGKSSGKWYMPSQGEIGNIYVK